MTLNFGSINKIYNIMSGDIDFTIISSVVVSVFPKKLFIIKNLSDHKLQWRFLFDQIESSQSFESQKNEKSLLFLKQFRKT